MGTAVLRRRQRDVLRCEPLEALAGARLQGSGGDVGLLRLVDSADVLVQSLRAALSSASASAATTCGRGTTGCLLLDPRVRALGPSREAGYDLLQAFAGLISITGEPDRPGAVGTS
jgi:hypothetical protein